MELDDPSAPGAAGRHDGTTPFGTRRFACARGGAAGLFARPRALARLSAAQPGAARVIVADAAARAGYIAHDAAGETDAFFARPGGGGWGVWGATALDEARAPRGEGGAARWSGRREPPLEAQHASARGEGWEQFARWTGE